MNGLNIQKHTRPNRAVWTVLCTWKTSNVQTKCQGPLQLLSPPFLMTSTTKQMRPNGRGGWRDFRHTRTYKANTAWSTYQLPNTFSLGFAWRTMRDALGLDWQCQSQSLSLALHAQTVMTTKVLYLNNTSNNYYAGANQCYVHISNNCAKHLVSSDIWKKLRAAKWSKSKRCKTCSQNVDHNITNHDH